MTTIHAHCPACGEVALTPDDIELRAGRDAFYAFGCPQCELHVRKPADDQVVRLLRSAGVPCVTLAPDPHGQDPPAFTYDDLLDLHDLLESDDWFAALLDSGGSH